MEVDRNLPDINRLSILTAIILLVYALSPFIEIPSVDLSWSFLGVIFNFPLNFKTYVAILTPLFAAVGTIWLLSSHPKQGEGQNLLHHAILPALSTWVIGLPLNRLPIGPQWWVVFALGGVLLVVVILAEYVVVDTKHERYSIAAGALKALSFALFLFLTIAIKAAGLRLYLLLPGLFTTVFLLLLRTLFLQVSGKWMFSWSFSVAFVTSQIAIGMHYLPLSPITYGFLLVGPTYALTDAAIAFESGRSLKKLWIEPLIMLILFLLLAVIV